MRVHDSVNKFENFGCTMISRTDGYAGRSGCVVCCVYCVCGALMFNTPVLQPRLNVTSVSSHSKTPYMFVQILFKGYQIENKVKVWSVAGVTTGELLCVECSQPHASQNCHCTSRQVLILLQVLVATVCANNNVCFNMHHTTPTVIITD